MSKLKRVSLWAAVATLIAESGAKNLLFSTLVTVGTPATTAGFVYEVVQMRKARLQREEEDRRDHLAGQKGAGSDTSAIDTAAGLPPPSSLDPEPEIAGPMDLRHRLTSMLIARAHFVDIYGGNPEAVTPVYQKVVQTMLLEDEHLYGELDAEMHRDLDHYNRDLKADVSRLRALHGDLILLGPARIATNANVERQ